MRSDYQIKKLFIENEHGKYDLKIGDIVYIKDNFTKKYKDWRGFEWLNGLELEIIKIYSGVNNIMARINLKNISESKLEQIPEEYINHPIAIINYYILESITIPNHIINF